MEIFLSVLFLFTVEEGGADILVRWTEPDLHGSPLDFYHIALQTVR
jgi:hypothetical protein